MVSDKKLAANRRNAQKSTGPKTLSGKAIASMNALKHGLCARRPIITGEDEAEFVQFTADWVDELRPVGARESLCAENIILTAWQLRRVPSVRAGLFEAQIRWNSRRMEPIHPFAMDPDAYAQLTRIDRHQAAMERSFDRSIKELEKLQAERGDAEPEDDQELQNEANSDSEGAAVPTWATTIPAAELASRAESRKDAPAA